VLFSTENLALRPLTEADFPALLGWLSNPQLTDLAWGEGVPWDADKVAAAFGGKASGGDVQGCIIALAGTGIGYAQFYPLEADAYRFSARMPFSRLAGGYGIDIFLGPPELWGQGLGPRLVDALARYLFAQRGASVVCADPETDNARSVRCWQKAGFFEVDLIENYNSPDKTSRLMARFPEGQPPPDMPVLAYISAFEGEARARMETLRALILHSSPRITEKISWGMPTFVLNGNLVHFAGQKNHLGFYPGAEAIAAFSGRFEGRKFAKGSLQLPYNQPIPWALLADIVHFRMEM